MHFLCIVCNEPISGLRFRLGGGFWLRLGSGLGLRLRLSCWFGRNNWLRYFLAAIPLPGLVGDWLKGDLLDQLGIFFHLFEVLASADATAEGERRD